MVVPAGNFVAIDFETANRWPTSACSIGLARVEGDRVVKCEHRLIRPQATHKFDFHWVHGITWKMTRDQPSFAELWSEIAPFFAGIDFIAAHNAAFDSLVLRECCKESQVPVPPLPFECTVQLARKVWGLRRSNLPEVSLMLGLGLRHHNAASDAEACARILLAAREFFAREGVLSTRKRKAMEHPIQLAAGVFRIPVTLSPSLEKRRAELEEPVLQAQVRMKTFALKHDWLPLLHAPLATRAEIHDSPAAFRQAVARVTGRDPAEIEKLPASFSACLEKDTLLAVAPEIYPRICPDGMEAHHFSKLLAHEMAHRLHLRILGGNEAARGPAWFYEGFACHAAGQFESNLTRLSPQATAEIMADPTRGNYRKFASIFHRLLRQGKLTNLLSRANSPDFTSWAHLAPGKVKNIPESEDA